MTPSEVEASSSVDSAIRGHRRWALPLLRAIDDVGGSGTPVVVEARLRELLKDRLTDGQWAKAVRGNYVRWARLTFRKAGLLGGRKGVWALTDAGREYLKEHASDPLPSDWNFGELSPEESGDLSGLLETVDVTDYDGYEIPILRLLEQGPADKQEIYEKLDKVIGPKLLPGDIRFMPRGRQVWKYRASWTLTNLKKAGSIDNPTTARWQLTESGRNRLKHDESSWSFEAFRTSKAKVRAAAPGTTIASAPIAVAPTWPTAAWRAVAAEFPDVAEAVAQRVRPDLGPTPPSPLPRNVVFYGPPGTGKTFVARKLAQALTGSTEAGDDSRWRLVQFHPSYTYEDFVQGLRPALKANALRYELLPGPFHQICKAAENDPDHFYVLVIDEINRGDPARIFGELLYALEYRGDEVELATGGELMVPPNLVVLGTMNSVDRSVALVDYALRRRFGFVRIDPDHETIASTRLGGLLESFNDWLVVRLDSDHAIGHSFFLSATLAKLPDDVAMARVWRHDVRPLLEEYFFAQPDRLKEAEAAWQKAWAATEEDEDEEPHGTG